MSIINAIPQLLADAGGYSIDRSLRFRSSASAYLSRTPASAGNRTTWTWSGWVKFGVTSTANQGIFSVGNSSTGDLIHYNYGSGLIRWFLNGASSGDLATSQSFRDPAAWRHLMFVFDTTQVTSSNRMKMYVNGVQITSFATATYPSQNYQGVVNTAAGTRIGFNTDYNYLDGYITEVNFIDGQALTPTSFGEFDTTTGVWKPKKYAGAYGTNGFYLNFSDNSAATAAAIGKDSSGNGNNWTPNNISLTAGVTYDSMLDVPTPTSASAANFCTLNPLQNFSSSSTDGNLSSQHATSGGYGDISATFSPENLKGYFEITVPTGVDNLLGFALNSVVQGTSSYVAVGSFWHQPLNGRVAYGNGSGATTLIIGCTSAATAGQIVMVAFDFTGGNRNVWFGLQGTWGVNASSQTGVPSTGAYPHLTATQLSAACRFYFSSGDTNKTSFNFGQRPFAYTPPSGFKALNTFNLPDSTIVKGNKYFDATLYTGTGAAHSVVNSGFQPDLVWLKGRSGAYDHGLNDSVRGAGKFLYPNLTMVEGNYPTDFASFDSSGFSFGSATGNVTNANGASYVAWQWKESALAGFDIVTYTGNGANRTIAHSLGVAPKMVIVKGRSVSQDWTVWHTALTGLEFLYLNSSMAKSSGATIWNSTTPTSTDINLGSSVNVNQSGQTYVAYCFAEIAGFSKFGSYVGNGSADGPFAYCGFRPKFVMIKRADWAGEWAIIDTSRSPYNPEDAIIFANASSAEYSDANYTLIDMLSNGFKQRQTWAGLNASGSTFIFMAFAENPFKNSLAR